MFINKEGKLFGKVSIIDILAVILIVVAAFGVYTRFIAGNEKVEVKYSTIEYGMKVEKVREGSAKALENGGPLYDAKTKEYMGEIVFAEAKPCFEEQEKTDGTMVLSEVPERYDVYLTVKVDGSSNEAGYYTKENKAICVGSNFVVASKYAETTGEIISVKEVK